MMFLVIGGRILQKYDIDPPTYVFTNVLKLFIAEEKSGNIEDIKLLTGNKTILIIEVTIFIMPFNKALTTSYHLHIIHQLDYL